jgi:hypothetical protein
MEVNGDSTVMVLTGQTTGGCGMEENLYLWWPDAKIKNSQGYISTPTYIFIVWC